MSRDAAEPRGASSYKCGTNWQHLASHLIKLTVTTRYGVIDCADESARFGSHHACRNAGVLEDAGFQFHPARL
eukprot:1783455-Amphidinium_carterae.1